MYSIYDQILYIKYIKIKYDKMQKRLKNHTRNKIRLRLRTGELGLSQQYQQVCQVPTSRMRPMINLPLPSPPFPLEVGDILLTPTIREPGERCNLSSGVWGRAPEEIEFDAFCI